MVDMQAVLAMVGLQAARTETFRRASPRTCCPDPLSRTIWLPLIFHRGLPPLARIARLWRLRGSRYRAGQIVDPVNYLAILGWE